MDTLASATARAPIWQRRYKTIRKLGEGAMGKVVLAERRADSLAVCLKFLRPDVEPRAAEQECRALMRLRHPSIVALLDFSLEDKPRWLATEYVDGSTLRAYLREHKPVPLEKALAILKPILDALDYAHGEGVIHRDLKPSNLMIEEDGSSVRMRILDFGIAIVDQFDHEGRFTANDADPLGTLLYMAPEQLRGELLSSACDLYAVGLMAWEMLMGRSVFDGKTRTQMLFEKVTRPHGFDLKGAPSPLPTELDSFVEACTRAEPGARPTAREGLALLQSI
jgi:serine/threonine-protein kinase